MASHNLITRRTNLYTLALISYRHALSIGGMSTAHHPVIRPRHREVVLRVFVTPGLIGCQIGDAVWGSEVSLAEPSRRAVTHDEAIAHSAVVEDIVRNSRSYRSTLEIPDMQSSATALERHEVPPTLVNFDFVDRPFVVDVEQNGIGAPPIGHITCAYPASDIVECKDIRVVAHRHLSNVYRR